MTDLIAAARAVAEEYEPNLAEPWVPLDDLILAVKDLPPDAVIVPAAVLGHVRQDLQSLVNLLGTQFHGSHAWKCGNLAAAALKELDSAFQRIEAAEDE